MDKVVSIVVSVYNVERYLAECIESILKQTYRNIEILLIDDGSLDNSGKICDNYAEKDSRIKVIHKENGGASSARNVGLEEAKGEFVMFIDGDDFVDEHYIEKMYNNSQKNNSDLVFCGYWKYIDGKNEQAQENLPKSIDVNIKNKAFIKFFSAFISYKNNIMGCCWRILYKKKILKDVRFNEQIRIAEDLLFVLQVILKANTLSFISEGLYFYRQNSQSVLHNYKNNYLKNQTVLYYEIKEIYSFINNKSLIDCYGCRLCYESIVNELKFKQESCRKNINAIRKSKLYQYFSIKNILRRENCIETLKMLIRWILVKTRLI